MDDTIRAMTCELCTRDGIHGTDRCLRHFDPARLGHALPALLVPADQLEPPPQPVLGESDKVEPKDYGKPVGFHEDDEPARPGWLQRWAQRLLTLTDRTPQA